MKQTVEKIKFDVTRRLHQGLVERKPKPPEVKAPMDPAIKKMIQDFNAVSGMQEMETMKRKSKELQDRIPGLNEKIEKLNKKMIETAARIELGKIKREVYQKLEIELAELERQKVIILTALKSILEELQGRRKEAIRQVALEAGKLWKPILRQFDEMLDQIEKLKSGEQKIRSAFCQAAGIDTSSSYGFLPPSWDLRVDGEAWRDLVVKDFLK